MAQAMDYKKLYYEELRRRQEEERVSHNLRSKMSRQSDVTTIWSWQDPPVAMHETAIAAYVAGKAGKYAAMICDDCNGKNLRLVLINKL